MSKNGLILEMKDGTIYGDVLKFVKNEGLGPPLHWMKESLTDVFTGYLVFIQTQKSKFYVSKKVLPNIELKKKFDPTVHIPEIAFINLEGMVKIKAQGFLCFSVDNSLYPYQYANHIYVSVLGTNLVYSAILEQVYNTEIDFPKERTKNWPPKLLPQIP